MCQLCSKTLLQIDKPCLKLYAFSIVTQIRSWNSSFFILFVEISVFLCKMHTKIYSGYKMYSIWTCKSFIQVIALDKKKYGSHTFQALL